MPTNRVSASLATADRDAVLQAIKTIREKLPFLLDLTPEERKSLPRLGDKSRAFVAKAFELASRNPDFLPRGFDIAEFKKDFELFEALFAVRQELTILSEGVSDTTLAAGSEAYLAALLVYNYAKSSSIGTEGLDEVVDELGKRFARRARAGKAA